MQRNGGLDVWNDLTVKHYQSKPQQRIAKINFCEPLDEMSLRNTREL